MRATRLHVRLVAAGFVVFGVCTLGVTHGGPQDQKTSAADVRSSRPGQQSARAARDAEGHLLIENTKVEAFIDKMIAEFDLRPGPLPEIPGNPPPHEGAMISLPYVLAPPDLVMVEVLDALPGRPISGERMIRPDGKISLGFYGEIDARGLTLDQLKVAVIKRLRRFLMDDALGLREYPPGWFGPPPPAPEASPDKPQKEPQSLAPGGNQRKTQPTAHRSRSVPRTSVPKLPPTRRATQRIPIRLVQSRSSNVDLAGQQRAPLKEEQAGERTPDGLKVLGNGPTRITITIEVDGQRPTPEKKGQPAQEPPTQEVSPPAADGKQRPDERPPIAEAVPRDAGEIPGQTPGDMIPAAPSDEEPDRWAVVPPTESNMVFVDVTAYNSQNYYVLGDVLVTGKMPCTGNETVLDALQHAGGLMPTAEPKDIRLLRPGRNGKPSRVYRVDLEAIQQEGDLATNYQIFSGDRLFVGRNEVVKRTVAIDRIAAPLSTVTSEIQRLATAMRSLQAVDPADADLIMKELTDFWAKELSGKGDLNFDEATLREALLQRFKERAAPRSKPK